LKGIGDIEQLDRPKKRCRCLGNRDGHAPEYCRKKRAKFSEVNENGVGL